MKKLLKKAFLIIFIFALVFAGSIYYFTTTYQDYCNKRNVEFFSANKSEYKVKVGEVIEINISDNSSTPFDTYWKNEKESKLLKQIELEKRPKTSLDKIYAEVNGYGEGAVFEGGGAEIILRIKAEKSGTENIVMAECSKNFKGELQDCNNEKTIKVTSTN